MAFFEAIHLRLIRNQDRKNIPAFENTVKSPMDRHSDFFFCLDKTGQLANAVRGAKNTIIGKLWSYPAKPASGTVL